MFPIWAHAYSHRMMTSAKCDGSMDQKLYNVYNSGRPRGPIELNKITSLSFKNGEIVCYILDNYESNESNKKFTWTFSSLFRSCKSEFWGTDCKIF